MPVHVEKRKGRYRLVEGDGSIAMAGLSAKDGGGHASRQKAERQASVINAALRRKGK